MTPSRLASCLIAAVRPAVGQGASAHDTSRASAPGSLHLHGYDIAASAPAGRPVVLEFGASQESRFGAAVHVTDDLLGAREKPVLWTGICAP